MIGDRIPVAFGNSSRKAICDVSKSIRTLQVIAGLSRVHGGPSYSVPRLCEALAAVGTATTLLSVADAGDSDSEAHDQTYRDCRFHWDYARVPLLRGLRLSRGLQSALDATVSTVDIVHDHGIWLMPNVIAGHAAARAGKPFMISPRGMLAPAARAYSARKKRVFWRLLQGGPVRGAACLHATSEQEYREIRDFGLSNPVAIIPNGIDIPDLAEPLINRRERIVLALGRIHPKKGLPTLLEAWSKVASVHPGWHLRIVGPAEMDHDDELRAFAARLGCENVSIEDPLYGAAKTAALRDADLFVLPTLNENFGLTVAEALAAGTAALVTIGAPWSGLQSHRCGWWIDHGVPSLAAALDRAMSLPRETLKEMGASGRAWMARDFSWLHVASEMLQVYRWLAGCGEAPAVVRFG